MTPPSSPPTPELEAVGPNRAFELVISISEIIKYLNPNPSARQIDVGRQRISNIVARFSRYASATAEERGEDTMLKGLKTSFLAELKKDDGECGKGIKVCLDILRSLKRPSIPTPSDNTND